MSTHDTNIAVQMGSGAQFKQMEDQLAEKYLEFQKKKSMKILFPLERPPTS